MPFPNNPVLGDIYTSARGYTYEYTADGGWIARDNPALMAATQPEVDAGIISNKYVSPATMNQRAPAKLSLISANSQFVGPNAITTLVDMVLQAGDTNLDDAVWNQATGTLTIGVRTAGLWAISGQCSFTHVTNAPSVTQLYFTRNGSIGNQQSIAFTTQGTFCPACSNVQLVAGDTVTIQVYHNAPNGQTIPNIAISGQKGWARFARIGK